MDHVHVDGGHSAFFRGHLGYHAWNLMDSESRRGQEPVVPGNDFIVSVVKRTNANWNEKPPLLNFSSQALHHVCGEKLGIPL